MYLRNYVRGITGRMDANQMTTGFLQKHMEMFYIALVSPTIEKPIKSHLILIFENLLTVMLSVEQSPEKITEFYNQLFNQINSLLSQEGVHEGVTQGSLLICQAVLQSIRSI